MENIDPKIVSKFIEDRYASSNITGRILLPSKPQSNTDAIQKSKNTTNDQFRSALLSVISSKEQTTHDFLNLPPPEYLRNMPPPNITSLGSPNVQQSQNLFPYNKAPNNALKPLNFHDAYNRQSKINRLPMSNLNMLTPPITPTDVLTVASNFPSGTFNYPPVQSLKKVVQHNLCVSWNINDHQGSLFHTSSPAHKLYKVLEECFDQFKMLQAERRKSEYEITKCFPHIKFNSTENAPVTALPTSSRIDHLITETIREHSRILTMCMKMDFYSSGKDLCHSIKEALEKWIQAVRKVQSTRYDQMSEKNSISIPDFNLNSGVKCLPIGEERKRKLHPFKNQLISEKLSSDTFSAVQSTSEVQILALSKDIDELNTTTKMLRTALWKGIVKLPPGNVPMPDNPTQKPQNLLEGRNC